jgi:penicillin-binding protein 1A
MVSSTNSTGPTNGRHSSRRVTRRHRRSQRAPRHNFGRTILIGVLLIPFLLGVLILGTVTLGLNAAVAIGRDAPKLADQKQIVLAQTSRIYAADGSLLSYLYGTENRTIVSGERIPRVMKDAIVAIEDERFYQHKGVDLQGVARALVVDLKAGKVQEGASSITMQLVGGLYLDRLDMSLTRKFREAMLAWQLETKLSKDEILDLYLNTIYFGSNAYGVEAAARTYFDKEPSQLTLPEAALLAGLPQAPTDYSPRVNMAKAKVRRQEVLRTMYANGFIDVGQYESAIASDIELATSSPYIKVQEPYVVAYTRQQLIDMFGQEAVYKGGLNVQTSINPAYQRIAQEAIASTLNEKGDPSAALVAVDPRTGLIRAMVGGTDYDKTKFNLAAQGRRQPGSAFKTFALVAAVEKGVDPQDTYYVSAPVSISLPGSTETWNVTTYGGTYAGPINLVTATLHSDNSVYAQLAVDVGAKSIVDVAHRMGITSKVNENPAIVLGGLTYGVSPFEMASAYGTLANQGKYVPPSVILKVTDASGKVLYEHKPTGKQAISAGVAYTVTKILEENVLYGTGTAAQLDRPVAGKTGTTEDWSDAWFCGFVPQLSTAVWVGHPEARISMTDVHGIRVAGGTFPAEIWHSFMSRVSVDFKPEDFTPPKDPMDFSQGPSIKLHFGGIGFPSTTSPSLATTTSLGTPLTNPGTTDTTWPGTTTHPPSTSPPTTHPPSTEPPSTSTPTAPVPPT